MLHTQFFCVPNTSCSSHSLHLHTPTLANWRFPPLMIPIWDSAPRTPRGASSRPAAWRHALAQAAAPDSPRHPPLSPLHSESPEETPRAAGEEGSGLAAGATPPHTCPLCVGEGSGRVASTCVNTLSVYISLSLFHQVVVRRSFFIPIDFFFLPSKLISFSAILFFKKTILHFSAC